MSEKHNLAVDESGKPLPYTGEEVRDIVLRMLDKGEVLAVILRQGDALGVQVFGPPSRELHDALKAATRAYGKALRGTG